ncbi:neural proliferation differentiation and control protein 1 isoform X2 [Myotis yumanensis]|uniref:neural proliferation differentiation and control protein 1 isoform X2 n=1 Tax=Myotis yumanensis TaxID=159337 RepID=UPI0038D4ED77
MATPVPPPSPRHLRLLRLLLSGLVLGAALRGAAAGPPDGATCPGSLDCALKRRARCPPGAHACGPCLQPFREDHLGLCVPRGHRPLAEGPPQPRLEDDIDFLAQELARQEAGRWKLTALSQQEAPLRLLEPAATLGLSARGQGPGLGLPSTRGAPAPTPRTSLGSPVSSGPVHMSPLEPRAGRLDGLALGSAHLGLLRGRRGRPGCGCFLLVQAPARHPPDPEDRLRGPAGHQLPHHAQDLAGGPAAGAQRRGVPLPAPEAADAVPGPA